MGHLAKLILTSSRSLQLAVAVLLPLLASSSQAHITLETKSAEAGSYYKAVLKVGHGCDGSSIKEISVSLPEGFVGAKPMPKPGWKLEIVKTRLATHYSSHGKTIADAPSQIRWLGGDLPDAYYDEFVIVGRLPDSPGRLYWKMSQVCENGRIDWAEIPETGKSISEYRFPAAILDVTPKTDPHTGH